MRARVDDAMVAWTIRQVSCHNLLRGAEFVGLQHDVARKVHAEKLCCPVAIPLAVFADLRNAPVGCVCERALASGYRDPAFAQSPSPG